MYLILSFILGFLMALFSIYYWSNKYLNYMTKSDTNIETFNNFLRLNYCINNKKYSLFLPYDKKKRVSAMNKSIIYNNESINHPLGVPFLVKSELMGEIIVEDLENGTSKSYKNGIIEL